MTDTKVERKQLLRDIRREAGLTQVELGELAGCSHGTVSLVEMGNVSLNSESAERICEVLGVDRNEVLQENRLEACVNFADWSEDGFGPEAPRRKLRWWRERRNLTQNDLALLAPIHRSVILRIEHGDVGWVRPASKHRLCKALRIHPDKLALPGEAEVSEAVVRQEDNLRADLRGAQRALRIAFDFMREDYKIANRYLDERDKALEVVMREMRGT